MSTPGIRKTWEGLVVDGKIPLRQWLGGCDHSAVFLTERPGQASKAAIKVIAGDGPEADRQLSHWRAAVQLSHPHLMRIFEAGRCRLANTVVLYIVMEYAEEDLSQILPQRPLAPAEVTELLPPLLDALSYLHGKGFVHGRIKPSNVLAVGDQLKLSADQIAPSTEASPTRRRRDAYDAPETAAGILSAASDVWSVGVTLVAALTQNVSFAEEAAEEAAGESSGQTAGQPAAKGDPGLPNTVPEPFRGIARECLHLDPKRRCSIAQIQTRLQPMGRSVPAETPPAQPRRPLKRGRVVAALLAAVVLVALIVFFSRGGFSGGNSAAAPADLPTEPITSETATATKPNAAPHGPAEHARRAVASPGGDVLHEVIPEVSQSSRNTITGTIKVGVRVEVNPSGKVTQAKLKSAGPSKYFDGLALKAAQRWEFSPQPTATTWLLQFRFKRSGIQASSERLAR